MGLFLADEFDGGFDLCRLRRRAGGVGACRMRLSRLIAAPPVIRPTAPALSERQI